MERIFTRQRMEGMFCCSEALSKIMLINDGSSAAPTLETHPLDPYAADPWNLNNLPILPQSYVDLVQRFGGIRLTSTSLDLSLQLTPLHQVRYLWDDCALDIYWHAVLDVLLA